MVAVAVDLIVASNRELLVDVVAVAVAVDLIVAIVDRNSLLMLDGVACVVFVVGLMRFDFSIGVVVVAIVAIVAVAAVALIVALVTAAVGCCFVISGCCCSSCCC